MTPALLRRPSSPARRRIGQAAVMAVAALGLAIVATGCTLVPDTPPVLSYDLGPAPVQPAGAARLPRMRVSQTDGPTWMDSHSIFYRLQYAQAQRLQPYATQRWVMSPLRLLDERLREAVAARGDLIWHADATAPALKIDVLDFEQVFDSADASRGLVRVRATVYRQGLIGQKTFVAERPAPTADGAGGVAALAAGSDAVVAQVLDWVATLPLR